MRRSLFVLALIAVSLLAGCGSDVAGHWCGIEVEEDADCVGAGAYYAELEESDDTVTGRFCVAFEKECQAITEGTYDGSALVFKFPSQGYSNTAELTVEDDNLTGKVSEGKCQALGGATCEKPLTLFPL